MFWEKYCALCTSIRKAPNVVASEIGIKSSGSVTGWKNGAIPRLSILHKIADYFGVPVEYLTSEEDEKIPATQMGSGDDAAKALYDFIERSTPEERQVLIDYANYIKSKRKDNIG